MEEADDIQRNLYGGTCQSERQSQQYSPQEVSREVSQERTTSIKKKRKSKVGHGDMTIPQQ